MRAGPCTSSGAHQAVLVSSRQHVGARARLQPDAVRQLGRLQSSRRYVRRVRMPAPRPVGCLLKCQAGQQSHHLKPDFNETVPTTTAMGIPSTTAHPPRDIPCRHPRTFAEQNRPEDMLKQIASYILHDQHLDSAISRPTRGRRDTLPTIWSISPDHQPYSKRQLLFHAIPEPVVDLPSQNTP
jgi:hypothetical protein